MSLPAHKTLPQLAKLAKFMKEQIKEIFLNYHSSPAKSYLDLITPTHPSSPLLTPFPITTPHHSSHHSPLPLLTTIHPSSHHSPLPLLTTPLTPHHPTHPHNYSPLPTPFPITTPHHSPSPPTLPHNSSLLPSTHQPPSLPHPSPLTTVTATLLLKTASLLLVIPI